MKVWGRAFLHLRGGRIRMGINGDSPARRWVIPVNETSFPGVRKTREEQKPS